MAATQDEGLGHPVGVLGAEREWGIIHKSVEKVWVVVAGGGDGREEGVEEEIWREGGRGSGGFGGRIGGGLEAREAVDGGAYGVELVEKSVRDRRWSRGLPRGLNCGGEMVEGEDVGGHHGYEKQQIQIHCEPHLFASLASFSLYNFRF
ncbi:hypothetical protein F2P56_009172 [Juglans regia]|uniref:Uncharacterized protein n=1 Tax=Juglans regia TaxID=51240 RepID=A0A833XW02_JUGRE|nr:hypothetical protein F2P56_009172 [Juglans regia]